MLFFRTGSCSTSEWSFSEPWVNWKLMECEFEKARWEWNGVESILKACRAVVHFGDVHDADFTIATETDPTVEGFDLDARSVEFLPTNLLIAFPNLVAIMIERCSVSTLNSSHFKGLSKLRLLNLSVNKIEHVAGDAFIDLINLDHWSWTTTRYNPSKKALLCR